MLIVKSENKLGTNHNLRKKGSWEHNKNIDNNRTKNNVILMNLSNEKIEEKVNKNYQKDVDKYNEKQQTKSRRILNYFKDKNVSKNKREMIFTMSSDNWDILTELSKEELKILTLNFKNILNQIDGNKMLVTQAIVHLDEKRPHMHVQYFPKNSTEKRTNSWNSWQTFLKSFTSKQDLKNWSSLSQQQRFNPMLNNVLEKYQEITKEFVDQHKDILSNNLLEDLEITRAGEKLNEKLYIKHQQMDQEVIDKVQDKKKVLEKELVEEINTKVSELRVTEQNLITSINSLGNEEKLLEQQKNDKIEQIDKDLEKYKQKKQDAIDESLRIYKTMELNELKLEFSKEREKLQKEYEELTNSVTNLLNKKTDLDGDIAELKKEQKELSNIENKKKNLQQDVSNLTRLSVTSMRLIDDNVKNKIKSHFENYELEETRKLNKQIEDIENDIAELTDPDNWDYFEQDYHGDIEYLNLETSKYVSKDFCNETISKLTLNERIEKQKQLEKQGLSFTDNGIGEDGIYLWSRMRKKEYTNSYESNYLTKLKEKLKELKETVETKTERMYEKFKEFILNAKQEQMIHQEILEENNLDYQPIEQKETIKKEIEEIWDNYNDELDRVEDMSDFEEDYITKEKIEKMFGIEYPKQITQSNYDWAKRVLEERGIETMEELASIWEDKTDTRRIYLSTITSWQNLEDLEKKQRKEKEEQSQSRGGWTR